MKLDVFLSNNSFKIALLYSLSFDATNVLIENERNASCTLKVLNAESFLPVKGYTSGPRWQELFKFTRHTKFTKVSIKGDKVFTSFPNKLTCCP